MSCPDRKFKPGFLALPTEPRANFLSDRNFSIQILTGRPVIALRRPRRRWEDNIRMYLKEIGGIGLILLRIGIIGEP